MGRLRIANSAVFGALAVALISMFGSPPAWADDADSAPQAASSDDGWTYGLAPYIWTAGIRGTVGSFGAPPAQIDVSEREVLENLDMAFMGVAEARRGRWGVFADIVYSNLSTSSRNTPGPFFGSASIDTELLFVTPMVEYQLLDNKWTELYPMAGVRVWYSKTKLNLSGGLLAGRSFSDDATWVDPTVGLRGRIRIADNVWLTGWGIIGGFDVDHDKFMWDAFGGVSYQFNDWISAVAGYRGTGTDYNDGGYVFDIIMQGPAIGAVIRF